MDFGMKRALAMLCVMIAPFAAAQSLRDPTRPPQPHAVARAAVRDQIPVVSAIFTRGDQRTAIVDGRLVKTGDAVSGGSISAISSERVRWLRKGIIHELQLNAALIHFKKPATAAPRVVNGAP